MRMRRFEDLLLWQKAIIGKDGISASERVA